MIVTEQMIGVNRKHQKKRDAEDDLQSKSFFSSRREINQAGTTIMVLPTTLESNHMFLVFGAYYSNLLFHNVMSANELNISTIQLGMSYCATQMIEISKGAVDTIDRIPLCLDILLSLLKERSSNFMGGVIRYVPLWSTGNNFFRLRNAYLYPNGSVYVFSTPAANPITLYDFNIVLGSTQDYARFLRVCGEVSLSSGYGGQVVEQGQLTGKLVDDPSAFAKLFSVNVGAIDSGSIYNVCELEVPFEFPMFSKMNVLNANTRTVAREFKFQSGTIASPIGLSMTTDMSLDMYSNKIPIIYKTVDFYQFYLMVVGWVFAEMNNYVLPGSTIFTTPTQFTFSASDFAFMLRQAVLSMFPEQCHSQFVSPLPGAPSLINSVFMPFIVDSVMCPNPSMSGLLLPTFMVQNLNMLRQVVIKSKSSSDFLSWVPVWGVYSGDTLPLFSFHDPGGAGQLPIFNPIDVIPSGANIWDGSLPAPPNAKANVNLFVTDIKNEFNLWVSGYAKSRSVPISPLSCSYDNPTSLLPYTRVLREELPNFRDYPNTFNQPIFKYILNMPKKPCPGTKSNLRDIPVSSYTNLKTIDLLALNPFGLDVVGALDYFFIPSIRFDPAGPNFLIKTTYQTITGEACNFSFNQPSGSSSPYEVARITTAASIFQSGFAAGNSSNDTLTSSLNVLIEHGGSVDFAQSLFGLSEVSEAKKKTRK